MVKSRYKAFECSSSHIEVVTLIMNNMIFRIKTHNEVSRWVFVLFPAIDNTDRKVLLVIIIIIILPRPQPRYASLGQ